jgi:hypothetical protein
MHSRPETPMSDLPHATTSRVSSPAQRRIVAIALFGGMALFLGIIAVVLAQREWAGFAETQVPLLEWAFLAIGVTTFAGALACRAVFVQRAAAAADPPARARQLFLATITPLALAESGVLLNGVAWLLNGQAVPSGLAAGLLFLAALVLLWPPADEQT